jgi:hypothetical protein
MKGKDEMQCDGQTGGKISVYLPSLKEKGADRRYIPHGRRGETRRRSWAYLVPCRVSPSIFLISLSDAGSHRNGGRSAPVGSPFAPFCLGLNLCALCQVAFPTCSGQ